MLLGLLCTAEAGGLGHALSTEHEARLAASQWKGAGSSPCQSSTAWLARTLQQPGCPEYFQKKDIAPIMELEVQNWVYEVHAASSREIITEVQVQDRDIAIRGQP